MSNDKWTRVFINSRQFAVVGDSQRVLSGPYAGGVFRPLPNQNGSNAQIARQMASGSMFSDGAYSQVSP